MSYLFIILFFILLLCEGIFRKWLLNSYSTPIFFIKYIFLFISFLFFYFERKINISRKSYPFIPVLFLYILWCIFEIFNFRITADYRVKILGLIIHLSFILLIFIVPYYLNSKQKLIRVIEILIILSIPIFLVGIIQYQSSPDSYINNYVTKSQSNIALAGGYPRITSVFSFITPYTSFLSFAVPICLVPLVYNKSGSYIKFIIYLVFILGVINMFMTGSRYVIASTMLKIIIILFYLIYNLNLRKIRVIFLLFLLLIGSYTFINFSNIGSTSLSSFQTRLEKTEDETARFKANYSINNYFKYSGVIGYGIGTGYQGASSLIEDYKDIPPFESENSRLIIELGIIGFLLVLVLRVYLLIYSLNVFLRVKDFDLKFIILILLLFQLPSVLLANNVIYNYMENALYWFSIAIIISINQIQDRINIAGYR